MMKSQNKLLLIFLILALSVCLALASSASNYFDISDLPSDYVTYGGFEIHYDGNLPFFNNERLGVIIFYGSIPKVGFTNIEGWHNFVTSNNITSANALYDSVYNLTGQSYLEGVINMYPNLYWQEYLNYLSSLDSGGGSYSQGIKDGIIQAHDLTKEFLSNNNILYEPWGTVGELGSLEGLLEDNVLPALQNKYNQGYNTGYNKAREEVYPLAFADGVNASITRMEDWLTGKNLLKQTTYKDGDLVSINQVMNNNVIPALDERQALGYELGTADGQALGNTEMYNLFIQEINRIYGTEYSLTDGINEPDLTVLNTLYAKAYEAGELYQLNKMTDDGGISDFLADISGTVLSTFFYIATNISFMGTSALSLISLFVIAVIVIFILKFVIKS